MRHRNEKSGFECGQGVNKLRIGRPHGCTVREGPRQPAAQRARHRLTVWVVLLVLTLRPDLVLRMLVRRAFGWIAPGALWANQLPLRLRGGQLRVGRAAVLGEVPRAHQLR
eukprot:603879-Prymnesium_polylepis.1